MIVIIFGRLQHYRVELINELAKNEDVVVLHSGPRMKRPDDIFREVVIERKTFGPLIFQKNLSMILRQNSPQVIMASFDLHYINSVLCFLLWRRKIRWVWWGLDKSKSRVINFFKLLLSRAAYSSVIYNRYVVHRLPYAVKSYGNCVITNNTISVKSRYPCYEEKKDIFLNVGSLDKRKKNEITVEAFAELLKDPAYSHMKLVFVGAGLERGYLEKLVVDLNIDTNVEFTGEITELRDIVKYYRRAYACISPGQAGLSVLQSFAYGVPFVTGYGAVSGGEIGNVVHNYNGLIVNPGCDGIYAAMKSLIDTPNLSSRLGRNAYTYFEAECKLEDYAQDLLAAAGGAKKGRRC